jgi:hypothetical protein
LSIPAYVFGPLPVYRHAPLEPRPPRPEAFGLDPGDQVSLQDGAPVKVALLQSPTGFLDQLAVGFCTAEVRGSNPLGSTLEMWEFAGKISEPGLLHVSRRTDFDTNAGRLLCRVRTRRQTFSTCDGIRPHAYWMRAFPEDARPARNVRGRTALLSRGRPLVPGKKARRHSYPSEGRGMEA